MATAPKHIRPLTIETSICNEIKVTKFIVRVQKLSIAIYMSVSSEKCKKVKPSVLLY